MAILNSLVVNGPSRFLGKIYAQDLEVSGTTSFQDISANTITASGRSTFSGGITVGSYSNTDYAISTSGLIVNEWLRVIGGRGWYNQSYGGGAYMLDANYVRIYGGKSFLIASGSQSAISSAPESIGLYLGNNRTYYFREDGKLSANQLIGVQASVGTVDANNVNVTNVLRANRFDLQTVSQAGGCILITPTVKYPNASTTLTVAKSGSVLTLTITDSSITSATMAGAVWGANSRVKVSGTINGIVTGTMDGTVTSINTTSHVLTLSVSGENSASVVAGSYTASQFQDLSVALYQRRVDSNDYRVGIWLNCYDTANESATIRIYGGTDSNPNVAIGNLTGMNLPQVNGVTPTGWSLYAANAYLTGTVVANAGLIGSWVIGERGIYYGSNVPSSTSFTFNPNPSDQDKSTASIGGSASGTSTAWLFTAKDKFGVDTTGKVYCNLGQIGGFTIDSNSLKVGTWGENNSVLVCTGTLTAKSIGGSDNINNWVFTGGATFGVTKSGAMYASSGKIGPWTMTATSLYKGNATLGTSGNGNIYIGDNGLSMSNKFVYKTSDGTLSLNVTSLKIAGEDIMTADEVASAIENSEAASSELIYGTQTAATSRWTGVSQHINQLYDGLQIRYWLPYAYSSSDYLRYTPTGGSAADGTGLTLTLSNGTNTDCIPCFYSGISRITSHYGAGNILRLTYRENVTVGSATVVKGWWADGNYDSGNTYDRTRYAGVVKTGTNALVAGNIIVGKDGIYQHLKLGQVFDVTMPIMYAASALAANQTNTGGWIAYVNIPISITTTQSMTLTVGSPVYIKGTLVGNDFTPISTTPLTQAVPSEYDGYQYIYLGTAYSSGNIYLEAEHPIYMYFGTKFMPISEISKTYMYYDSTNGLVLSQNEVSASTDLANAGGNVRLTNSGMGIYSNNTQLANYGDTITIGKTGTSDRNVYVDSNGVNIRLGTTNISSFGADMVIGRTDSTNRNILVDSDSGVSIRQGTTVLANYGTDMTIGRTDSTNRNIFVDSDSGVSIRKGTTVLANYGDTITINHGTSGKKALTLDSTNGAQFYKLDGSTLAAQLNADGLTVSVGKIGNWVINSNGLYYTSATPGSTSITLIPGGTTAATTAIGGSSGSKQWVFTVKDYFGIDTSGNMFSKGGKIGGFDIGPSYLVSGTWGSSGSVMMSTGTSGAKSIGGSADTVTGWAFTAGSSFGVTNTGDLYASSATISGAITATSGSIGNFTIGNGKLYSNSHTAYNTAVAGVYIGDDYISFGSGGVTYFKNDGTGKVGPWTLSTTYIRNGNIASATNNTVAGVYLGTDGLNISNGTAATTAYITKTAVNIGNKLTWDGTTLSVTGSITANSGSIAGFHITSSANTGTSANGGHAYTNSLYRHSGDGTAYEYEVGIKGDAAENPSSASTQTGNLAFYIKRIAKGAQWSTATNIFYVTHGGKLYASDAEITGTITAKSGTIGANATNKITIGTNTTNASIYSGMSTLNNTSSNGFYIGTDGIALGKGAFKVTSAGALTTTSGSIAGWTINSDRLSYGTPGASGGALISPAGYTIATASGNITGNYSSFSGNSTDNKWIFAASNIFGVTSNGRMYSKAAYIEGGIIGGWNITSNSLHCKTRESISPLPAYSGMSSTGYAFFAGETNSKYGGSGSNASFYIAQSGEAVSINRTTNVFATLYSATISVANNYGSDAGSTKFSALTEQALAITDTSGSTRYQFMCVPTGLQFSTLTSSGQIQDVKVSVNGANGLVSAVKFSAAANSRSWLEGAREGAITVARSTSNTSFNSLASVAGVNGKWGQGVLETNDAYYFSYALNTRTTNGGDYQFCINPAGSVAFGGTANATFLATATTGDGHLQVKNNFRNISVRVSTASIAGIWDIGNQNWMIYSGSNQVVNIPHPLSTSGHMFTTDDFRSTSKGKGLYLVDSDSQTFPAICHNGTNLWIGSAFTNGPHHIGGTYISAGYTGSAGNPTIYICVPNANNNGGSNYAVLHQNNYTSYVTSAKNVEDNVRRIVTTTDTESQYCSAVYTNTPATLCVRGRWGGTSYATKNMANFGSDIRLKTNINNTEVKSGLDMINSIKLHSFDWTDHEEHQKIGFVADELEKLDPHFSIGGGYEEDGTMNVKSVDVFYMQGFIVKSIQEEDSKVSKLEKEVKALKKQIKELEARLS